MTTKRCSECNSKYGRRGCRNVLCESAETNSLNRLRTSMSKDQYNNKPDRNKILSDRHIDLQRRKLLD